MMIFNKKLTIWLWKKTSNSTILDDSGSKIWNDLLPVSIIDQNYIKTCCIVDSGLYLTILFGLWKCFVISEAWNIKCQIVITFFNWVDAD